MPNVNEQEADVASAKFDETVKRMVRHLHGGPNPEEMNKVVEALEMAGEVHKQMVDWREIAIKLLYGVATHEEVAKWKEEHPVEHVQEASNVSSDTETDSETRELRPAQD